MSLPQQSLTENKPPYHTEDNGTAVRPSAAYGMPFCRFAYWWSKMSPTTRQGVFVMFGTQLSEEELLEAVKVEWQQLAQPIQQAIITVMADCAVCGMARDCAEHLRAQGARS